MNRSNKESNVSQVRRRQKYIIIATAVYFLMGLLLVLLHEPWRDEANPWLIAEQLQPGNIYSSVAVEAHPILWYLLLWPFAALGLPYITTNIVSLLVMTLAVYLLLRYFPGRRRTKVLIILSSAFFYFNPVISRDYCLVVLFAVLTAMAYRARQQHPVRYALCLALLAQGHFLIGGLVAAMSVGFLLELLRARRGKAMVATVLILAASLAAMLPLVFYTLSQHPLISGYTGGAYNYGDGLGFFMEEINKAIFGVALPILQILVLAILLSLAAKYRKLATYLLVETVYFMAVLYRVYQTGEILPQRASVYVVANILMLWLTYIEQPKSGPLVRRIWQVLRRTELAKLFVSYYGRMRWRGASVLLIAGTIPLTLGATLVDVFQPYSNSLAVAAELNQLEDNAVILMSDSDMVNYSIAYAPLLEGDRYLYDTIAAQRMGFAKYHREDLQASLADFTVAITEAQQAGRPVYYVVLDPVEYFIPDEKDRDLIPARFYTRVVRTMGNFLQDFSFEKLTTFQPGVAAYEQKFSLYKLQ